MGKVIRVTVHRDDGNVETINMIDGDSCVIECPDGIVISGKYAVLKWKIKRLEETCAKLRKRIEERDVTSLESSTTDQLLNELKLRTEHYSE